MIQPDLFAPPVQVTPPCGSCANLGSAIESGVRYCGAMMMWRGADERPACGLFKGPLEAE